MYQRVPFDIAGYERRTRKGRCFVCATAGGDSEDGNAHLTIYADRDVLLFLNRYPTLVGYALVCPRRHVERVIGDFGEQEYLKLQGWIYRVGRAIEQVVPTERLYILSLGSQQGNRHVHWHLAPLPAGIAYVDQQFAALRMNRGVLAIPPAEMAQLARQIRDRLLAQTGPASAQQVFDRVAAAGLSPPGLEPPNVTLRESAILPLRPPGSWRLRQGAAQPGPGPRSGGVRRHKYGRP